MENILNNFLIFIVFCFLFYFSFLFLWPDIQKNLFQVTDSFLPESGSCQKDNDCVIFGKTGDCNCGCYSKNNLPTSTGGECFCLAPTDCRCVEGKCKSFFEGINNFQDCERMGFPILESYPRQCKAGDNIFIEEYCVDEETEKILTLAEAKEVAIKSECGDNLEKTFNCNQKTGTYWIDLDLEKEDCNPACVVDIIERTAKINWRCTGLIK